MPDSTVAAPVAATPVAAPTPTPSAPVAPVAPEVSAPVIETPAVSATPAAVKPEPTQADFPGDIEGFLRARREWENQPEETPAEEVNTEDVTTEEVKAEEPAKTEDEAEEVKLLEEPEAVTPEALNSWLEKVPSLKSAFEESPELKNAMFAMARTNAKAAPLLEIFPNVDSAKFAHETSNTFVGIRTGFLQAIDNPESFGDAYQGFAEQFIERNADGTPKLDPEGNPVYGEDFHLMNNHIVDGYFNVDMGDLKDKINSHKYGSEAEKENDEILLKAFEFVDEYRRNGNQASKPDLSILSPEARAYLEQKEQELSAREGKLNANSKTQTAEQRKAERAAYDNGVAQKIGASVGKRLDAFMKEKEAAGVFVPSYVTDVKDPKTGISVFALNLFNEFQEKTCGRRDPATGKIVGGVAHIRNHMAQLEMLPPSKEAEKQRLDYVNQLIEEHLPAVLDKNLRAVQRQVIQDRQKQKGGIDAREKLAHKEPTGGSSSTPVRFANEQAAYDAAAKEIDAKFPDLSGAERLAKVLSRKSALLSATR